MNKLTHEKRCATDGNSAVWLAAEAATDALGIKAMTLAQMAEEVLRDACKPLKMVEIAVAMQGRGYRSTTKPPSLLRAIRDMFKRCPGRFVRGEDGRWQAVGKAEN